MLTDLYEKLGTKFGNRARWDKIQARFARAGIKDPNKIETYTAKVELLALMDLAAACPDNGTILEIGSHLGASTAYIAAAAFGRGITIYCVDTWDNLHMPGEQRDIFQEFKNNLGGAVSIVRPIRKHNSELTAADIHTPIDFAFLDADHSYESTRFDFRMVHPWMGPNGIMAFHDSQAFEGVSRVIGEVLASGAWCMAGQVANLTWLRRADWKERTDHTPSMGDILAK